MHQLNGPRMALVGPAADRPRTHREVEEPGVSLTAAAFRPTKSGIFADIWSAKP
jgi:hypothetical protein